VYDVSAKMAMNESAKMAMNEYISKKHIGSELNSSDSSKYQKIGNFSMANNDTVKKIVSWCNRNADFLTAICLTGALTTHFIS